MRQYINIKNVGNNNGEILNKFNWDLDFRGPQGIGNPGDELFKGRLITVSGLPSSVPNTIDEVEVAGGFSVTQIGEAERKPVTITFEFQDYDDQRIARYFYGWSIWQTDPRTKKSNTKKSSVCQCKVYQLDTSLTAKKKTWILKNGLLEDNNTNDSDFSNKKELSGKVTIGIKFEWWDIEY